MPDSRREPKDVEKNAERLMRFCLLIGVLDTLYLSWRFLALQLGWVTPGTGICSWTTYIDCDIVLMTPEARAFYVPNAILGWGFFSGTWIWWTVGKKWYPTHRYILSLTLSFWLGLASLFASYFIYLLVQLPALCPFCPWNHLWTYLAFAASLVVWRNTPKPTQHQVRPLLPLVLLCVGWFWLLQLSWMVAFWLGVF
jgi:uncharacterized membrane protein